MPTDMYVERGMRMIKEPKFVYVVNKQEFSTGVFYGAQKVFLHEEDAIAYCEKYNSRNQVYNYMGYQRVRFYG